MNPKYSPSAVEIEAYIDETGAGKMEAKRHLEVENLQGLVIDPEADFDTLRNAVFYILDTMKR